MQFKEFPTWDKTQKSLISRLKTQPYFSHTIYGVHVISDIIYLFVTFPPPPPPDCYSVVTMGDTRPHQIHECP